MAKELTAKEEAEWDALYKAIIPLETNLAPVLRQPPHLSREECAAQVLSINKQLKILHDLPRVDGQRPDQYMYETFELLRQRCIALHWRCIQLDIQMQRAKAS